MHTSKPSNSASLEDAAARVAPGRDPESWARELPAPLPAAEVAAACEELLVVPVGERREVLHRRAGQHEAAGRIQIVAALVDLGYSFRHSDPHRYLRIAQLASQCAYRYLCSPAELRPAGRQLRTAAFGFLANAYRVVGRFRDAERRWQRLSPLEESSLLLSALLLRFEAALASECGRLSQAIGDLEEAIRRFQAADSRAEVARTSIVLSKVYEDVGSFDAALATLYHALPAIDGYRCPEVVVTLLHNLTQLLTEKGDLQEAAFVSAMMSRTYKASDDELILLRARGVQGCLLRELGALEEAVEILEAVKDAWVSRQLHYEAAVAGLELALALSRQHRQVDVMLLANEMYSVFVAHDIPREAVLALMEFHHAAESLRADATLITSTLSRLKDVGRCRARRRGAS